MKNILISGDLHITQDSLEECSSILNEQKELIKQYNIDTYIDLGDTFDNIHPSSSELDLFSSFLKEINIPSIIIAAQSHESETPEDSIVNHFGILNNKICVVKEYWNSDKLFVGHFGLKEAKLNKFGATRSTQEFKKFKWVILGHFHSHEIIKPNCCQLGSSRWVTFAEAGDKQKVVLIIENYDSDSPKCSFIPLKSPIPMIDIELNSNNSNKLEEKEPKNSPKEALQGTNLVQEGDERKSTETTKSSFSQAQNPPNLRQFSELCQIIAFLDKIDPKTKIRIIFKDYQNWVEFLPLISKYSEKFTVFKQKKDFILNSEIINSKKENVPLKESLVNWLEKNKIPLEIQKILKEEIK